MALDLSDLLFQGPALPEPYVKFELEHELNKLNILPKATGKEGDELQERWDVYRRKLRALNTVGGPLRVQSHVIEPLLRSLGYDGIETSEPVRTSEEPKSGESGGALLVQEDGSSKLRTWSVSYDEDLFAPARRGRAYRFSHLRVAQRVLKATGERLGLLTNGVEAILLISEPARIDSTITFSIDPGWRRSRRIPDSFRFFLALCSPSGVQALPDLIDKARLQQTRVTKELRVQARQAVERFAQEVLDHPANREWYESQPDKTRLAKELWHEGLIIIYRLLFILKLESSDDPARVFTFASNSVWRNTYSPTMALASFAREALSNGAETGSLLETGVKTLFRMFERGCASAELNIKPLGGALFGENAAPHFSGLTWGERSVALVLDRLLWTPKRRGSDARERVHYGSLDVEDLGRVYEALLELDAGITTEPMCRLRRSKLEVVVPAAQGEKYRPKKPTDDEMLDPDETDEDDSGEEETAKAKKTKVEWIEEIPANRFFLRVGLGRKATGSYYTPHSFVKFLVQETINPLLAERSPAEDPKPVEILRLKIVDIAMGSGHFLAEACRYLGSKLYEACRRCDEKALEAERKAEESKKAGDCRKYMEEAQEWRQRIIDLPDPEDEILMYLPSRSTEGEESGLSRKRAEALCRRLVATHCLYGVDKNPLAVELAKLVLWIEAHAEGMPLTFLDHRLVAGDSLTGAFWDKLIFHPSEPAKAVEGLFAQDLQTSFTKALGEAIRYVGELDASVGASVADVENKRRIKADMDRALLPFRVIAAAWSGGVMLGREHCDPEAYERLLVAVVKTGDLPKKIDSRKLLAMISRGLDCPALTEGHADGIEREELYSILLHAVQIPALPFDLMFPEVFYPNGVPYGRRGFHVVLGNPPWDRIRPFKKEFLASYDFLILDAEGSEELQRIEKMLLADPKISSAFEEYNRSFQFQGRIHDALYEWHEVTVGDIKAGRGNSDSYLLFMERNIQILRNGAFTGVVVPSAFHANEGATGIRRLYLEKNRVLQCYSFENRRQLFEIHRSFKFVTLVAQAGRPTDNFKCSFYLHDDEWLFDSEDLALVYDLDFVKRTGGKYLSFLELKNSCDAEIVEQCYRMGISLGSYMEQCHIEFSVQADMTRDKYRFTLADSLTTKGADPRNPFIADQLFSSGYLLFHEGKTFHQYDDRWGDIPKYIIAIKSINDRTDWLSNAQYYKLCYRGIASSTNERTSIFHMLPVGVIMGNSAPAEKSPERISRSTALCLMAIANSFSFDWLLRLKVGANINQYILLSTPLPESHDRKGFLAHLPLRLIANSDSYRSLWEDQLGDVWRESIPRLSFPVLPTEDDRWNLRSAIDAVVADAYGLSRDQYEHVLSSFSHSSYPKAPELCLAKFDELKKIGLKAFTKKYDPYWDVPINESPPKPVINISGVSNAGEVHEFELSYEPAKKGRGKRRK